ncbi:MAG: DUF177 domain-containing protein [Clostridiales bacterium]|nr:DUF177 domain-containing protein [Clostridiales bacterium]
MIIDLRPLLSGECSVIDIDFCFTPDIGQEGMLPLNLSGVHFPRPARAVGNITDNAGYMRLALEVSIEYEGVCARCLEPVVGVFKVSYEKTVATIESLQKAEADEDDYDEYAIVRDGMLDIDEQLGEMLLLEFPTKLLCRDDCTGLCSGCGRRLDAGMCGCEKKEIDPRLKVLEKFLSDYE